MTENAMWQIAENGVQKGPFSSQQVQKMVALNTISANAVIWQKGWPDWRPLAEVFPKDNRCLGCNAEFKFGLIGATAPLTAKQHELISLYDKDATGVYCTTCGTRLLQTAVKKAKSDIEVRRNKLSPLLMHIPIVTAQSPQGWEYDTLQIVTAQSTTGTGFLSEFTATFADLFGAQSEQYSQKLKGGENFCFAVLRTQALKMGGNAIIAVDIDYSEIGTSRGLLMVCTAGTVVRLKNLEVLGNEARDALQNLSSQYSEFRKLRQLIDEAAVGMR